MFIGNLQLYCVYMLLYIRMGTSGKVLSCIILYKFGYFRGRFWQDVRKGRYINNLHGIMSQ